MTYKLAILAAEQENLQQKPVRFRITVLSRGIAASKPQSLTEDAQRISPLAYFRHMVVTL